MLDEVVVEPEFPPVVGVVVVLELPAYVYEYPLIEYEPEIVYVLVVETDSVREMVYVYAVPE